DRDWTAPAPIIHVGPLPNDDRFYVAQVELAGDVPASLVALASSTAPKEDADVTRFREEFRRFVRPTSHGLTSQDVLGALREALRRIKAGQERKGLAPTGTTFGALDYRALAAAFGADGVEARTVDECRAAFRDAARSTRVTLVAAHVDPAGYRL